MPKRTCSLSDCPYIAVAKGYCDRHYRRVKKYGDPRADHTRVGRTPCVVEGCETFTYRRGYCSKHWSRLVRGQDLHATTRELRGGANQCSVEGCERPRQTRGWCGMHYSRWKANGDPLIRRVGGNPKSGPCKIGGCGRKIVAQGMCEAHYRKWRRYGDPEHVEQKYVTRTFDDHPSGCRVMRIVDTQDVEHEVFYDAADEDIAQAYPWYINPAGYTCSPYGPGESMVFMARLILGLGPGDEAHCDHVNGHRSDNRRANLRPVTVQRNQQNKAIENHAGSSRFRGVHWDSERNRWQANVKISGRKHHVGRYLTEEEAGAAVARYREEHDVWPGYKATTAGDPVSESARHRLGSPLSMPLAR